MIFSLALLLFQFKPVQTWAAKKATAYLEQQLHTKIGIKSLYLRPFSSLVLEDFYVLDKKKDTLISTPKLAVEFNKFSLLHTFKRRVLDFKRIEIDNGSVYLKQLKDSTSNLQFILDYFSGVPADTAKSAPGKPWKMIFENTVLNNFHFRYKNMLSDTAMKQVNFDDVDVTHLSMTVKDMDLTHHLFKGEIRNLTLHEKSGFYLKKFNADATVDTNQIIAKNLLILTNRSIIKNYFRMRFKSFDDFSDVENKVYMTGDFHASHISSSDISYFTDGLDHVKFDLGVDGKIKGLVNNLSAKSLLVTGGKATYVKGDFSLRGLPDWNNTFLELNFQQLYTNKADMDYLLSRFTDSAGNKMPDFLSKFGSINFTGSLTGTQNDFVTYGTFKTSLGRFDPDINIKIDKKGIPAYSGKVDAYALDMGSLLDAGDLGRATFTANVRGRGDDLNNLNGTLNAKISQVVFKGYNYNNLAIDGSFVKKVANANITVADKNIGLKLNGSVDLNPALPVYDISADISKAQVNKLKLFGDTVTLTTKLAAKFSGNDLSNLTGKALLTSSRITDPRNDYPVDTVQLASTGSGDAREISLKSDFADSYIKGSFDLATLPSYFKTILKKYIPSLKTDTVAPGPQNFSFNLTLKKPNPLIAIFMPGLSVPDQGTFIGQFNSATKTADLNAYVKTIKLGKTVFHDFIIDENTSADNLSLNLSLSKINFTDSLFIKNITLINTVRKDSLNFNLKLSDQNAVNSLDLYGLVHFGKDTTARLQVLPSDVMLEHEDWRLQQKVDIRLRNGKTQVKDFELSNGDQTVKINGLISDDPADVLNLTFDKFSMATFNQLTRPSGVELKGQLNGNVKFTSILNSPGIDAELGIDTLMMNKTLVGNVNISSDLGNDRKQANVNVNIKNQGLETLNIGGVYTLGRNTDDNLNFDVKMDHTETIIFEPFIKDLVSNIKGTISTDLKLTGTPAKPQLNGNIILSNTGVTVNYLQTAYTVNDTLNVANSVINLNRMILHDSKSGTGIVTGTVDLNDLANPNIQAVVQARNLMALNTNFKDNHLYFGTAFATGRFKFSGPIDNINIDIKAKTEAGTLFNIPLNSSSTVGDYDFIKFVSHKDTAKVVAPAPNAFNGVTLNFDLSADEKTTVKITTEYGVLEGNGVANDLRLKINSLGDFEMYGDYLISSGKFDFTAKNFISKNFTVNQGGTIRWTGDPTNASINLSAIYEVRTDIKPLYQAAGSSSPKGDALELVQAELILTKSLMHPNIDFDFNFPLDPSIKDDLSNYLSDVNNRSEQALNIIVRRQFSNGANNSLTNAVLGTAGEVMSEFAFNKLNSFISQSNIKGFDLNIRSFNDATLQYRFKDRLILTGSLFSSTAGSTDLFQNNSNLFNSNFNELTKDFEMQYLIRKNGDLSARYSYRLLNSTTLNTIYDQLSNQYVNGLGLVYQQDFDTFGEFIKNLFKKSARKKRPARAQKPQISPATTTDKPLPQEDDN